MPIIAVEVNIFSDGASVHACAIGGGYAPAAQPSYSSQAPSTPTAPRATPASKPAAEPPMDNFDDDIPF